MSSIIAGVLLLTVNIVFADISSLLFFNTTSEADGDPASVAASSDGPPDWDFGSTDDSFYLARDGLGVSEQVNSTSSALYNNNVTQISLELAKVNNPRGNLTVGVWNEAGTLRKAFATVNASSLATSPTTYDYPSASGLVLGAGDRVGVRYVDNSSNSAASFVTPMNITSGTGEFTLHTSTWRIHAEKVPSTSSPLYNQDVNSMIVRLRKAGAPTGTIEGGIFNGTGAKLLGLGTLDISKISTTGTDFLFYNATHSRTLVVGDYVGIKYAGGDASNNLKVFTDGANPFNGTATYRSTFNATTNSWTDNTGVDQRMILMKFNPASSMAHRGLDLDGTDDFVFLPVTTLFANQTNSLTITAWVKPDVFKEMNIISNFRASTDGWGLQIDSSNRPTFEFRSASSSLDRTYTSRYQLSKGADHFLALIYNGTHTRFFIDGQLDNRELTGTHSIKINTAEMLRIGNRASGATEIWNGMIKDLHVWNRVLSDSEVLNLRNGVEPSTSNLVLHYDFTQGKGPIVVDQSANKYHGVITNNGDAKFNPAYLSTSIPNFVKVSIDASADFDNTEELNDPFNGDIHTWVFGINNDLTNLSIDTHTVLNRTMLYDLKNRGIDTVVLTGVHTAFNGGHAVYPNVWLPWIALAHAEGLRVIAATFEDVKYLDVNAYPNATLQSEFQTIITASGEYFDGYTTNIEPVNLANFTANKAYYLERWMNITNILDVTAEANDELFLPTLELTSDDADIAALTQYTNGIDDLTADGVIIENYKLNSTLSSTDALAIINNRDIPQIYLISLRDVGGSNKHNEAEWHRIMNAISSYNTTNDHVWGIGGYAWAAFIDKTDTVFVKPTLLNTYNGTGYTDVQKDLSGSVVTVNRQTASLANDDNTSTFWQNGVQSGAGQYLEATTDLTGDRVMITEVEVYKPDARAIPELVDIYVDGTLAASNYALDQSTGLETIDINDRQGDTVRIQVDTLGTANSMKLSELDMSVEVTEGEFAGNAEAETAAESTETNTWIILNIASFGVLFAALFTIFGRFGFE